MILDLLTSPQGHQFDPRMKILLAFCSSPVENKNDLELDFNFFSSSRILVVQTLYMMNPTDATLASLSVLKN